MLTRGKIPEDIFDWLDIWAEDPVKSKEGCASFVPFPRPMVDQEDSSTETKNPYGKELALDQPLFLYNSPVSGSMDPRSASPDLDTLAKCITSSHSANSQETAKGTEKTDIEHDLEREQQAECVITPGFAQDENMVIALEIVCPLDESIMTDAGDDTSMTQVAQASIEKDRPEQDDAPSTPKRNRVDALQKSFESPTTKYHIARKVSIDSSK